jgi:hypothetical protein
VIFKVDNASCNFGLAKDIQDYFRKFIFLYFVAILSFFGFSVEKFDIGSGGQSYSHKVTPLRN